MSRLHEIVWVDDGMVAVRCVEFQKQACDWTFTRDTEEEREPAPCPDCGMLVDVKYSVSVTEVEASS